MSLSIRRYFIPYDRTVYGLSGGAGRGAGAGGGLKLCLTHKTPRALHLQRHCVSERITIRFVLTVDRERHSAPLSARHKQDALSVREFNMLSHLPSRGLSRWAAQGRPVRLKLKMVHAVLSL